MIKIKNKKNEKERKKKREISCLAEKPTCFWKEMTSNSSLGNSPIIASFWKMCVHLKGECCEIFPSTRNGLGWMHKLIKEHILETLGWLK